MPYSAKLWLRKTSTYEACMNDLDNCKLNIVTFHRRKIKMAKFSRENLDESLVIH